MRFSVNVRIPERLQRKLTGRLPSSGPLKSAGLIVSLGLASALGPGPATARADETCMSPYMAKIEGQEEYVYVWTLGMDGLGDGSDKLVTVDVRPGSDTYGKVVHSVSVGGRHEAHHGGFTDDRRQLWVSKGVQKY